MADKARTLEDNRLLGVAVADLRVSVQGLEATKEQLEADRYTAQTSLDKVEQEYHQVLFYLSLRLSLVVVVVVVAAAVVVVILLLLLLLLIIIIIILIIIIS